mgnify:CR=1 FL=1
MFIMVDKVSSYVPYITFVRIDEQGESIPISDRVKEKYGFN